LFSLQELTLGESAEEIYEGIESRPASESFARALRLDPPLEVPEEMRVDSPHARDFWQRRQREALFSGQNDGKTAEEVIAYIENKGYYRIQRGEHRSKSGSCPRMSPPIWIGPLRCNPGG